MTWTTASDAAIAALIAALAVAGVTCLAHRLRRLWRTGRITWRGYSFGPGRYSWEESGTTAKGARTP